MKTNSSFRSLRVRLLAPMIAVALLAAAAVAMASYWLGNRWANEDLQARFQGIEKTLSDSSFPLNATVLELLADLTQTELVGLDESGRVRYSTADIDRSNERDVVSTFDSGRSQLGANQFRVYSFATVGGSERSDRVARVAVLFDEAQIESSRRRAALLPLATGLSTVLALTSITLVLTSRLISRLRSLQHRVEAVASGDFEATVSGGSGSDVINDEIGYLGQAVDSMAVQLDGLWKRLNRQQSEKLLHQIAGGMAHQLRNSLTGARMAVELHATECATSQDEGIRVAIHQIELSEDYVRRLLLVASGRQDEDRPRDVLGCFDDLRSSLSPIAKHLRIEIDWDVKGSLQDQVLRDGPTWVAAVTNLIQNAMQAGDSVQVVLSRIAGDRVRTIVIDNGAGVADTVASEIFEPFVTSKPEGMGLGLPLVRRAAEYLGGEVRWRREGDQTIFEFDVEAVASGEEA